MKYKFLSAVANVLSWARVLVTDLNRRDAQVEARLDAIEARLTAGGL